MKKPIIGIIGLGTMIDIGQSKPKVTVLQDDYIKRVYEAGGLPIVLTASVGPYDDEEVGRIVELVDGVLLSGGEDIHPMFYGQEPANSLMRVSIKRDTFEIALIHECIARGKSMFGICRGIQILNVALGGTLYQDIIEERGRGTVQHMQRNGSEDVHHSVALDGLLKELYRKEKTYVNSFHHQAVKDVAEDLLICAESADGIAEACVHKKNDNIFAVQWHPERASIAEYQKLFQYFVQNCQ
jgi:putative glutamine amidotransferase